MLESRVSRALVRVLSTSKTTARFMGYPQSDTYRPIGSRNLPEWPCAWRFASQTPGCGGRASAVIEVAVSEAIVTRVGKARLDVLLLERGLVPSRSVAVGCILAGRVFSGEQRLDKPG